MSVYTVQRVYLVSYLFTLAQNEKKKSLSQYYKQKSFRGSFRRSSSWDSSNTQNISSSLTVTSQQSTSPIMSMIPTFRGGKTDLSEKKLFLLRIIIAIIVYRKNINIKFILMRTWFAFGIFLARNFLFSPLFSPWVYLCPDSIRSLFSPSFPDEKQLFSGMFYKEIINSSILFARIRSRLLKILLACEGGDG